MDDDEGDEEDDFGGMFEDGHWTWDDSVHSLVFVSDIPPVVAEAVAVSKKAPTGTIEFRDNIDLIEQMRFRKRFQRKTKDGDVVTLQDVKDIALYTAPVSMMSLPLIKLLHTISMERFLRALIFYCQYYIQTGETMAFRMSEMCTKLRQPICKVKEDALCDNLSDLRVLVGQAYCTMIAGGSHFRKYHHMGPDKKRRSLTDKDARLFETMLRMCIQIVWLALGRKAFNQIELEIHRLFKSETFNLVEHKLKTKYIEKMSPAEKFTLIGRCNKYEQKLMLKSPLYKEIFCHDYEFRLTALGLVGFENRTPRLDYLETVLCGPEQIFIDYGVTLGIIGMARARFDTMLQEIKMQSDKDKEKSGTKSKGFLPGRSSKSLYTVKSSTGTTKKSNTSSRLYPEILLPPKGFNDDQYLPVEFPKLQPLYKMRKCSDEQRLRWMKRYIKQTCQADDFTILSGKN